ncbi:aldo/keto reductase [Candidatus Halocynthiibacter alkanivorans]|uniref:aldo/keto reductase n=1 Tax=Candidatus Halocynthiibacter alkanivorans TaxID=2267619 RepID=UPI000DF3142F|nr:aldo/keto reductase [Candidatus Halocynthiibacter alkanivorans]
MRMRTLGSSDLVVSELCLGSMTWGTQNSTDEGHAQIDYALERGVNFIDTAEMYPVNPVLVETVGDTEVVIGKWLAKRGRRDDVVIATKASGANGLVRGGRGFDGANIGELIDASLRRLQTDVIDLYQLHWPDRGSYHFRQNWKFDPSGQDRARTADHMAGVLEALAAARKAGKIRHVGLSNESAWGASQWLRISEETGLPRMVSVQNEYSLLCRLYDLDMAEVSANENLALFAYSPMAAGLLSGKYQGGTAVPEGSRMSLNAGMGGRITPRLWAAVAAYVEIAERHGMAPAQMALAWTLTRPFMGSSILGSTSLEQLDLALGAADLVLSDEVLAEIEAAHKAHPMPF